MIIKHFFDENTSTLSYVVHSESEKEAIIIDSVWDFDSPSGILTQTSVNKIIEYLNTNDLTPALILETHAHADHISGAQLVKKIFPNCQIATSERIKQVQNIFSKVFNIKDFIAPDGSQFDRLLKDWEEITIAGMTIKVVPTPGHTPACSSYLIGDAIFTGDAIFMPDYGTGRCDFPGGSAKDLYNSISKNLYSLPDETRVFVGHDYQPGGRPICAQSTIGDQKNNNIHLDVKKTEEEFIALRESRDATLSAPRLLLPSIQINIRAGKLPDSENNGVAYLKLPLDLKAS